MFEIHCVKKLKRTLFIVLFKALCELYCLFSFQHDHRCLKKTGAIKTSIRGGSSRTNLDVKCFKNVHVCKKTNKGQLSAAMHYHYEALNLYPMIILDNKLTVSAVFSFNSSLQFVDLILSSQAESSCFLHTLVSSSTTLLS